MADDTLLGRQLDEYRLDALLGHGGMARVYRGFDVNLERDVAIKVIDTPYRAEADFIARFKREAQAIARLTHPHIVRVYRYGDVDELLYIAMEYIEGTDLAATLWSRPVDGELIAPHEAGRIIRQICLALDYIHSQGIIHRDIKPGNVMLTKDRNAIVTDFGLALQTTVGTQGQIFGTAEYMAPEQVISSALAVPQSDLYAVGVMLYKMFTGDVPFTGEHPDEIARMHIEMPPPPPRETNPDLSPALEAVILKALAKEAEDRYPTGAALAAALEQALRSDPTNNYQEADMPYKDELRKLIAKNSRRLQVLKEKKALMGLNTAPEVVIEIEDIESEIERLEKELASKPVNEELGPYRLATIRGRGGMAEVYRAYDSELTRFVAIKVLHRHLSEDDAFVDRFYNEATTVANLKHPNIVQVYAFKEDHGKYYMVMELIDGNTLEAKLVRRRTNKQPFTLTETTRIFEQLTAAIDYAHAKGVVHHDLKPANIMFEGQRMVLTDFGIARLVDMAHQTASWVRLGTPAYMAPEQVRGERGDTRSDIYALGVILYELITGNEPTPLLIDEGNVSPAIKEIILKALSKNPNDRYQTAGEMAEALESLVKGSEIQQEEMAQEMEVEPPPPAPPLTSSKRRRLERELQDLEGHIDRLSQKISALRGNLSTETRVEERMRLEGVIQDNKKILEEFESRQEEIEQQLKQLS